MEEVEELEMIAGLLEERLREEFIARFPQGDEGEDEGAFSRWLQDSQG